MWAKLAALALGIAVASGAGAEAVDTRAARAALFPVEGYAIRISSALSAKDRATVEVLVPLIAKRMNQPVRYYAAIAWSPKDGLVHEALQAALNHHSPEAAGRAAVAACNTLRSSGAPACRVAAQVVPKGYQARGLTLSVDATRDFERRFRRMKAPKAFAISPATGAWGIGRSDAAARQACGVRDCEIVIRE